MAMRRANGSGNVVKMKGNRRKPWRARVTVGWTEDGKQILKNIGYFESRKEADKALVDYLSCPYDLTATQMTFKELYEVWFEEYREKLSGVSSERTIKSAFSYCGSLYQMKVRDIRSYHLEECMRTGEALVTRGKDKGSMRKASAGTQARMKSMFNLMFDYACKRELVDRNCARAFEVSREIKERRQKEKRENYIFSPEEIQKLWDNVGKVKFAAMVLIGVYSRWRPQELAVLKLDGVDLEGRTFKGGMKTAAGIGRTVPIHKDVFPLVESYYREAEGMGSEFLFNDPDGQQGTHLTYDKYRGRFNKVMSRLGMEYHHPHETRHTWYTAAKRSHMDDVLRDRMMGHQNESYDVKKLYDHQTMEDMKAAMDRVSFL